MEWSFSHICITLIKINLIVTLLDIFKSIVGKQHPNIKKLFEDHKTLLNNSIIDLSNRDIVLYANQQIDKSLDDLMVLNDMHRFRVILTTTNGDCLYNAIAIQLFGSQDNYFMIKLGKIEIILRKQNAFTVLLARTGAGYTLETLIEYIAVDKSWGNKYFEIAISILCNRPLHAYTLHLASSVPFSHLYDLSYEKIQNKLLLITFKINHFSAILASNYNDVPVTPINNQFINFSKLFE